MAKMQDIDFVRHALKALGSHTVYASGAFGASIGNFPSQLDRYYKNTLEKCGKTYADKVKTEAKTKPCFAFDCCGLPKGILFGWGAVADDIYGGGKYESNGVPDFGTGVINDCTDVSTDFSKIVPGELLWISGHVGIYIGNGYAVECTTGWSDNVQKTVVTNIKSAGAGEHGRKWTKHGKLPYVEYTQPAKLEIVCPCCGAKFIKE